MNLSEFHPNNDLKISEWVYQWKIPFNSDISKQVQEVTFFNNIPAARCSTLKNVNMYLDERLILGHHVYD